MTESNESATNESAATEPNPAPLNPATALRHVVLGAGPVGRAVVAELVAGGHRPTIVTRSGTQVPGAVAHRADVTDPAALRQALDGADVVYQCAQPEYHRWAEEFPALQAGIVDAVADCGALLVVVENLYGYGDVDGPLTDNLPLRATTKKGAVRARLSLDLIEAHQAGRIRMVAGRASDFFGPHVDGSAFGERFVSQVRAGKKVDLLGDPDALHTVTYVPDLAAALVRLANEPDSWGRAWHVPNAPAVSQRALVEFAARAAGTSPGIRRVATWQLRALGVFVAPMREMVEMAYEFEHDFVVDASEYIARFGDHSTDLATAFAATFVDQSVPDQSVLVMAPVSAP
jgi:nucleoside-diphosphate-sugar epimerase